MRVRHETRKKNMELQSSSKVPVTNSLETGLLKNDLETTGDDSRRFFCRTALAKPIVSKKNCLESL